jgi:hypothetical protein
VEENLAWGCPVKVIRNESKGALGVVCVACAQSYGFQTRELVKIHMETSVRINSGLALGWECAEYMDIFGKASVSGTKRIVEWNIEPLLDDLSLCFCGSRREKTKPYRDRDRTY